MARRSLLDITETMEEVLRQRGHALLGKDASTASDAQKRERAIQEFSKEMGINPDHFTALKLEEYLQESRRQRLLLEKRER